MTTAELTKPQRRYLAAIIKAGTKQYNGRARKPLEVLEAAGLVEYDYDLIPHVKGNGIQYTESFTVRATSAGRWEAARLGL